MPFDGNCFRDPSTASRLEESRVSPSLLAGRRRDSGFDHVFPSRGTGALRLLRRARALIAREETWVQGHYSGNGGGYCAVGALLHAGGHRNREQFRQALSRLLLEARSRGFVSVEAMNDASSHPQLLAAFDRAAAAPTPLHLV